MRGAAGPVPRIRKWVRWFSFFFQAEDGIRDYKVTGVQTCALPILVLAKRMAPASRSRAAGGASSGAATWGVAAVPTGVGSPRVAMLSLTVAGTPSSRADGRAAWGGRG